MVVIIIVCRFLDTFLFELVSTYFIQVDKISSGSFGCFTCPFTKDAVLRSIFPSFHLLRGVWLKTIGMAPFPEHP